MKLYESKTNIYLTQYLLSLRLLQPSIHGWRIVFCLSAAIYASSSVLYLFTFKGETLSWNNPAEEDEEKDEEDSLAADYSNKYESSNKKLSSNDSKM